MGDTNTTIVQQWPPSPSRECRTVDGWTACFYPGFVRRLSVAENGVERTVVYEQEGAFFLPAGADLPWTTSQVEVSGGPNDRKVALMVDDPQREIESIVIRFKPRADEDGEGTEEVRIIDTPILCPPICPEGLR